MSTDLAPFAALVPLDHGLSVVVTRRADLTPRTSVVAGSGSRSRVRPPSSDPTTRCPAWTRSACACCCARSSPPRAAPHEDLDEYDRVMKAERRTAVFVAPTKVVG